MLLLTSSACATVEPTGWHLRKQEPIVISPTPGRMFGVAPLSWDLPSGEQIQVAVDRARVVSGMGFYRSDIAFTASVGDDAIRCESEPAGPEVPPTRFGCWSVGTSGNRIAFWIAPTRNCPPKDVAYIKTATTPDCWHGELELNGERASLRHGYLKSTKSPVGYITWVTKADELLLAANIVSDLQVRLFEPQQAIAADTMRQLTLLTVALSWWEHASSPDA